MIGQKVIIELLVRNHPGVMSHVTGLFSRRGFNVEGVLCSRIGDGAQSRIYLLIEKDDRIGQIMKQLCKLYDVEEVKLREKYAGAVFDTIHEALFAE